MPKNREEYPLARRALKVEGVDDINSAKAEEEANQLYVGPVGQLSNIIISV